MFTGIIEEVGKVKAIEVSSKMGKLTISCNKVLEGSEIGHSIATNGVCLTINSFSGKEFSADVSIETLNVTNLGTLKSGDAVNLERALSLGHRLGGHLVSGHVDGIGVVSNVKDTGSYRHITIKVDDDLARYIIPKGSVTIDGISLTVVRTSGREFELCIIPTTLKDTTLDGVKVSQRINVECDIIGKYVERLLNHKDVNENKKQGINENFLLENGFM